MASRLVREHETGLADLIEQIDFFRVDANRKLDNRRRTELGQFMTPAPIARLMASMLVCDAPEVSLLDAGAGVGSLLGAAVDVLCRREQPPQAIRVTAYEVDPVMLPYLRDTLQLCATVCDAAGITFNSEIITVDFIDHAVDQLTNPLFGHVRSEYTCAILNPPYRKIQTDSSTRRHLHRAGIETSNLYTGFLALAMHLLAPDGELVAITPRSFCNGPYFRPFRELLLRTMALRQFHLFESREQAFRDDTVLQESLILSAVKSEMRPQAMLMTTSTDQDDEMPTVRELLYTQVVHPGDPQLFIHLVSDSIGAEVAARANAFSASLADLGLAVSTGRVVDFRAASFLRAQPVAGSAPLIYPGHILDGGVIWPKLSSKKPNALVPCDATRDLFVPNEHYVLVKRFSAKEERRRVVAAVYDPAKIPGSIVGWRPF
jgi:adenine-specific DNA-methyltransferase